MQFNDLTNTEITLCSYCGSEQKTGYNFCSRCGRRNAVSTKAENATDKRHDSSLKSLIIYTVFTIVLVLIMSFGEDTFEVLLIWTIAFALIDILFSVLQPSVFGLLTFKSIRLGPLMTIIAICIISGVAIGFIVDEINLVLFDETESTFSVFASTDHPKLYAILISAVFPAIFEELAFRGFLFNNFRELSGSKAAVWGSSFLFALVHLSFMSIIWIFPFGLLLGYFRKKYNTLIYGIIGHFTHNTIALLVEFW